jgi:hypothetical protein
VWVFEAQRPEAWFEGSIRWLPVDAGQCEALALDRDGSLVVTNERGSMFRLTTDQMVVLR